VQAVAAALTAVAETQMDHPVQTQETFLLLEVRQDKVTREVMDIISQAVLAV
jgi:hypothetical protein